MNYECTYHSSKNEEYVRKYVNSKKRIYVSENKYVYLETEAIHLVRQVNIFHFEDNKITARH